MIEMRKFKSSVFKIRLISSFLLFFFKSTSEFLDVSSESMIFSLFYHCCSISDETLWKFNVVSEIEKFLDKMKALSDKKFVSEALQAWFALINEKISAAFWLSKSAYLS